jgi:hypothetical protein
VEGRHGGQSKVGPDVGADSGRITPLAPGEEGGEFGGVADERVGSGVDQLRF